MRRDLKIYLSDQKESLNVLWFPSEAGDFVVRWPTGDSGLVEGFGGNWLSTLTDQLIQGDEAKTREDDAELLFEEQRKKAGQSKVPYRGRIIVTPSSKQRFIASSIRFAGKKSPGHDVPPPIKTDRCYRVLIDKTENETPALPRQKSKFALSPDAVCDVMLNRLKVLKHFGSESSLELCYDAPHKIGEFDAHPNGVIVIAGGTGTGKSTIARGFALRHLLRLGISRYVELAGKNRSEYEPPHLVTFEDPIEGWTLDYVENGIVKTLDLTDSFQSDLEAGIRVTARAKGYDVDSLATAHLNALRQKPDVIYVGECREPDDWKRAIELGGTGHLVVTTCHASSLADTFVKLAGEDAKDAQGRQLLASSLLGVIHLRNGDFSIQPELPGDAKRKAELAGGLVFKHSQTYCNLWRRTPESVSNFVVDGLASIVIDNDNTIARSTLAAAAIDLESKCIPNEVVSLKSGTLEKSEFFEALRNACRFAAFQLDIRGE